jgi:predicted dinucleotide-binding enzyme
VEITVLGTGFIGGTLGRALASAGHRVTFGSRHPDEDDVAAGTEARVVSVADALHSADVVILAVPGTAVAQMASDHREALARKLVIDATNRMGESVSNSRADLPSAVRYARAFNTLGGENMANPAFDGERADMFFSSPDADRMVVEEVIEGVGLRPVFLGPDQEALVDCFFRVWIALAFTQGRGRRLAFRLLEDPAASDPRPRAPT